MNARRLAATVGVALVLAAAPLVRAQEGGPGDPIAPPPPEQQEQSGGYADWMEGELERIDKLDLYGVSAQVPEGYFTVKWDYTMLKASRRYNGVGEAGNIVEPVEFTVDHGDGQVHKLISLDLGVSGEGGGHTFQLSYGISDWLNPYVEIPFQYMTVKMNPKLNPVIDGKDYTLNPDYANVPEAVLFNGALGVSNPAEYTSQDFMCRTLPDKLGRPTPGRLYEARWVLGDINAGFSYNFYRSEHLSAHITPRVYFPTGRVADANQSLLYATGPQLDTGIGGWAAGATAGYDIRLWKPHDYFDFIFSSEMKMTYGFEQQRKYPTNFTPPDPLVASNSAISAYFPDLSSLEGTFSYTPGMSVEWTAQLQAQLALVGLAFGYGISFSQEPEIDADPNFVTMVNTLEILGQQTIQQIQVGGQISLLPLYIPLNLGFAWRKVVGGQNAIIFDDYYQITVQGYLPVYLLWE
jgi:hypothetical protein